MLTKTPVLTFYDVMKPITVSADMSSYGLGGTIYQQEGEKLRPIAYCSHTLTQTETKYAQIEKECLAGVWACEKFSRYLVGLDSFKLLTDHKPLVLLINNQGIDSAPIICQRLLIRMRRFNVVAQYVPGKQMVVPDTVSRSTSPDEHIDEQTVEEVNLFVDSVLKSKPMSDAKMEQIVRKTEVDEQLMTVKNLTQRGWPDQVNSIPEKAKDYFASPLAMDYCYSVTVLLSQVYSVLSC
jgi:hypothetical protein